MKIALVSPYDWAVPGGVNSHVRPLAAQFIRAGHEVRIIAPSSRRLSNDCDYLTVIGEHVIGLPASGSVANVCLSFNLGPRVKRLLKREGFDIVHMHDGVVDVELGRRADRTMASGLGSRASISGEQADDFPATNAAATRDLHHP